MFLSIFSKLFLIALLVISVQARAQRMDDRSDKTIGPADTRLVLDAIAKNLKSPDAKVTELRRSTGSAICGSVNVKNRDGLYTGERGFVVDVAEGTFGRVPDGPELLSASRGPAYEELDRVRQLYFRLCLD